MQFIAMKKTWNSLRQGHSYTIQSPGQDVKTGSLCGYGQMYLLTAFEGEGEAASQEFASVRMMLLSMLL